jgi:hypothetical protein
VDTGKTIAKSSKAAARSGICQWPDSILEPIWFSRDEVSKEYDECQYKIVVSVVWSLLAPLMCSRVLRFFSLIKTELTDDF